LADTDPHQLCTHRPGAIARLGHSLTKAVARFLLPRRLEPHWQAWRYSATALDAVEERILITGFSGRLQYINSSAAAMFDLSQRDLSR